MNLFICVYDGSINTKDNLGQIQKVTAPAVLLFDGSGKVEIGAGKSGARLLYCEGEPLSEPVARTGPFVMNTQAELKKPQKTIIGATRLTWVRVPFRTNLAPVNLEYGILFHIRDSHLIPYVIQ